MALGPVAGNAEEILLPGARAFVRWSVEHAAYSSHTLAPATSRQRRH